MGVKMALWATFMILGALSFMFISPMASKTTGEKECKYCVNSNGESYACNCESVKIIDKTNPLFYVAPSFFIIAVLVCFLLWGEKW